MSRTIFITGGARSGKSRLAEKIAEGFGTPLLYIATGQAGDAEMAERIAAHLARRGEKWQTVEEPLRLPDVIKSSAGGYRAVLVDCVTLWLTNILLAHDDAGMALDEVRALAGLMPGLATPLILVSNEVGMGIVPDNALARTFRDLAGKANEILAAAADEVYVTFCGLPLKLK
ncbi:MAG TPA: bifunctional adenosylcobinamide kinase/adenosylcobinamide-phosphate guanylyltransferase [Geobacteraceae bacterium]|nr:bifunctional adenosylcobinamide kinase/adenosylcobinamide-phosphate guanylyltransferase [Geobacteraceae bacterium]